MWQAESYVDLPMSDEIQIGDTYLFKVPRIPQ